MGQRPRPSPSLTLSLIFSKILTGYTILYIESDTDHRLWFCYIMMSLFLCISGAFPHYVLLLVLLDSGVVGYSLAPGLMTTLRASIMFPVN